MAMQTLERYQKYYHVHVKGADSVILHKYQVHNGTDMASWLQTLDALVMFETPMIPAAAITQHYGTKRVILVVNPDWFPNDEVTRAFVSFGHVELAVKSLEAKKRVMQMVRQTCTP